MPTDLRGVEINVGDTVIYAGTINKSVTLVEAKVETITDEKHIRVEVIRRFHTGRGHVRFLTKTAGDLIVVTTPASTKPDFIEAQAEAERIAAEHKRIEATHGSLEVIPKGEPGWSSWYEYKRCSVCKESTYMLWRQECTG